MKTIKKQLCYVDFSVVMGRMSSYVEALIPNMMVFGDGPIGR